MVQSGHVGHTAVIPEELNNTAAHALIMFQERKRETSPHFLNYQFLTDTSKRKLDMITTGNTIKHILASEMKNFEVFVCESAEENLISDFFRKLDDTIALHQRKLDILKQMKKGFLQQLFPKNEEKVPRVRFANFDDEWELRKLKEIAEFNPRGILPDKFEYVDLESVVGTDMISHRTEMKEEAPSRAQRVARYGDVFYQTVRPYQKNNHLYELPYDNYVFSTGYAQLRPNVDSYFLLSRIQENHFVNLVLARSTGTSYPAINSNDLAKISIKVSTNKFEQQKIGTFFKHLDDAITLYQKKTDKLITLKKSYLQTMFI